MSNITGFISYRGIVALQAEGVVSAFRSLIERSQPSQILEIGTSNGGLTLLISDLISELGLKCHLRSYDIEDYVSDMVKELITTSNPSSELITKNLFNSNYTGFSDGGKEELEDYIQRPGTTVVLCDGGYKVGEFNLISGLIKQGDIIMAHDYSKNEEHFEEKIKNKIWNWMEVQEKDIDESCTKYNLEPYMAQEFANVVWVCKIKK